MSTSAGHAPPEGTVTPELSGPFGVGELQLGAWIAAFGRMSDAHPDMARILRVIERLQDRPFRAHIVIHGEPGTGKEGLARLLHRLMHPSGAPNVRANLTGCTPTEMFARLFGPGAHRGAGDVLEARLSHDRALQRQSLRAPLVREGPVARQTMLIRAPRGSAEADGIGMRSKRPAQI